MADQKIFAGPRIRRIRNAMGLTQTAMAEGLGISPSYLNLIERNQRPLTVQLILKLASVYDVEPEALQGEAGGSVAALREVRRVLRPNGRAVLIEHSKSDVGPLGAYQDLTSKPVKTMSKGCVWNQDVEALIAQSGMRVVKTQRALLGLLVVVEASPSL